MPIKSQCWQAIPSKGRSMARCGWLLPAIIFLTARSAEAGSTDDTVFLTGGGRVRGLIVEESPTAGVRLRMPDGTLRTFAKKDVDHVTYGGAPAAPAPTTPPVVILPQTTGVLHVETSEPATISVAGGDYGHAPQDIASLPVGKQTVVVHFDGGGEMSRVVFVRAGATTTVRLEPTPKAVNFRSQEGVHFGVGGEAVLWYKPGGYTSYGLRAFGRMNIGLSPAIDFRLDAALGVVSGTVGYISNPLVESSSGESVSEFVIPISVRPDLQFNLSGLYSLSVGLDLGIAYASRSAQGVPGASTVREMLGIHGSPLTLRFGERRNCVLAAQEGFLVQFGDGAYAGFEQTVSFTYIFLPSVPDASPAARRDDSVARY